MVYSFLEQNGLLIMQESKSLQAKYALGSKSIDYFVGSFIEFLYITASPYLRYLEDIVKGNMFASMLFYDYPNNLNSLICTEVYFDTTFIVYLLGYAGEVRETPAKELLSMLLNRGARLRCFRHTFEEIREVLESCKQNILAGKVFDRWGTLEYFINPQALDRDIKSISAINNLRKGNSSNNLEECKAFFVTTNKPLDNCVNSFTSNEHHRVKTSLVFTDELLATLLWLKNPHYMPDLPKHRIIAYSYAAMKPSDDLWNKYMDEIDHLKLNGNLKPEDYYLLASELAPQVLMEISLGDDIVFTNGTINEMICCIKNNIREEDQKKLSNTKRELTERDNLIAATKEVIKNDADNYATLCVNNIKGIVIVILMTFEIIGVIDCRSSIFKIFLIIYTVFMTIYNFYGFSFINIFDKLESHLKHKKEISLLVKYKMQNN